MANTLAVTNAIDIEFVDEHLDILKHLEKVATRRAHYAAQVAADDIVITDLGMKIRRGLVRYKGALDANLPATIADVNVDKVEAPGQTNIYWNAAAVTHRSA